MNGNGILLQTQQLHGVLPGHLVEDLLGDLLRVAPVEEKVQEGEGRAKSADVRAEEEAVLELGQELEK